MSKPLVVIVDTDEEYLSILVKQFLRELDDRADLDIISDAEYFEKYFSKPVTAEIVVVEERLYSEKILRHNIANLFVLSESREIGNTHQLNITRIYKYLGIRELYNELTYKSRERFVKEQRHIRNTRIIAFYSPIGGSGKTIASLGLAGCLSKKHKNVLYINTESIQEFGYYFKDRSWITNEGYRNIKNSCGNDYAGLKRFMRKEYFDYLPAFYSTLDARGLDFKIYHNLIISAKNSGEYDFIIVDIEAGYKTSILELLEDADKVLVVTLQDEISVHKMQYLLQNLNFSDREKYMVICTRYNSTKENSYINSNLQEQFPVKEYIYDFKEPIEKLEQTMYIEGIERLSYMFI